MTFEDIRERFQAIGLGASFPRPDAPWTRLGDHIDWLDLVGIGQAGIGLHCDKPNVSRDLLQLAAQGVFPRMAGEAWFDLAMPIGTEDPLGRIVANLSPRGREGECGEDVVEAMRRIARRDPSLLPGMLQQLRGDLRFRLERVGRGESRRLKCHAICSFLVEAGEPEDLELLCSHLGKFTGLGVLRFVLDVHSRGWHLESCFLSALEAHEDPLIHELHEALLRLREGRDISDLHSWLSNDSWSHRLALLKGIHGILPQARAGRQLLELLLPRIGAEDDSDCSIALGWLLGLVLEGLDGSAAMEVVRTVTDLPLKEGCGFHAAMRALIRTRLDKPEREALLLATDAFADLADEDAAASVAMVRLHLAGAPQAPVDLSVRLQADHGWLQDLAEPGRTWDGLVGAAIEGRLEHDVLLWLCLDPESKVPLWLRTHWLRVLIGKDPNALTVAQQATRPTENGKSRMVAAHALLMHPGEIEPDPLYLACLSEALPQTFAPDSLAVAVRLLSLQNDPGLQQRAAKFLLSGGALCREAFLHWNSCVVVNDFDEERVETACDRLVELGASKPPRPLGCADAHSHALNRYRWSGEPNGNFLMGDLGMLEPSQMTLRLESLKERRMLEHVCRRLATHWKEHPETILAAWELLNDRKDWEAREAVLFMVQGLDRSFLEGRAGERRRTRLLELLEEEDRDVSSAARKACERLGIETERSKP